MTASSAVAVAANLHVLESLVDLDPVTRQPYNALAKADPEKVDDTTYRIAIRDGATFHDGSAVTADDVVFSFERVLDEKNASLFIQFLPFLDGVKKVDASTVEFKLKYPFALFAERLSVVKVVPKKIVKADQKKFDSLPIGSGPRWRVGECHRRAVVRQVRRLQRPAAGEVTKMTWLLLRAVHPRHRAAVGPRPGDRGRPVPERRGAGEVKAVQSVQSFGLLFLMFNCKRSRSTTCASGRRCTTGWTPTS